MMIVSGVGILTVRTPVLLLPARHTWTSGIGRVVEVSTFIAPAPRLTWKHYCSHSLQMQLLAKKWEGLERRWAGLSLAIEHSPAHKVLPLATVW